MRIIVTIGIPSAHGAGYPQAVRHELMPGVVQTINFTSPYLVSAGQTFEVHVQADILDKPRTLADVLQDVVRHGLDNPTHGFNCACLDKFIREVRSAVHQVAPTSETEPEWEKRIDARNRVAYVLRAVGRDL